MRPRQRVQCYLYILNIFSIEKLNTFNMSWSLAGGCIIGSCCTYLLKAGARWKMFPLSSARILISGQTVVICNRGVGKVIIMFLFLITGTITTLFFRVFFYHNKLLRALVCKFWLHIRGHTFTCNVVMKRCYTQVNILFIFNRTVFCYTFFYFQ